MLTTSYLRLTLANSHSVSTYSGTPIFLFYNHNSGSRVKMGFVQENSV